MAPAEHRGLNRRAFAAGVAALSAAPLARGQDLGRRRAAPLIGAASQGGAVIGRAAPRAEILVNGEVVGVASASGLFVVGFDRDEAATARISLRTPGGENGLDLPIAAVDYDVQRIDGLPADQVEPVDPLLLERIAREAKLKADAYTSRSDADDFRNGFVWPVKATRMSSRFGGQRILNGVPQRPHYGVDLAAPIGSPIVAPASGLVVLAEPDLHFEGGLTLIDHGQGLVAAYLHQSKVLVHAGDRVRRGQKIGEVGMTGRATGPHLCWRLKWRGRNLDPSLLVAPKKVPI